MKRFPLSRTVFTVLTLALLTSLCLTATPVTAKEQKTILYSDLKDTVGLALDNRGNLYTADRGTGSVYCLPAGGQPTVYAQVPDTPTSLTADRQRNVFIGTAKGHIFRISPNGSICEIYRCESTPVSLDVDRDGGLVIVTTKGEIIRVPQNKFFI